MDRCYEIRKEAMLAEAEVHPQVFEDVFERMGTFLDPYLAHFVREEQARHASDFISGLISDVKRKNTESIAYFHDQDRKDLQNFIGQSPWDHEPLMRELTRQVGVELGSKDAVISIDPSGFPKKGTESVGVQRQYCGRLGKVENCQVAVYLAYVSGVEHALVNTRLYLPKSWAQDEARREKARVPKDVRYQTRHKLALDMLDESGELLPHAWVTGDDEMGRNSSFRRELRERQEQYLLSVPSNTWVRDLEIEPPPYKGQGTWPKTPFQRVDKWRDSLPNDAWTKIDVRDGEKAPLVLEIVKRRVQTRLGNRRTGPEEVLVVTRCLDENGITKYDYYLSSAPIETELAEFARVATAHHRIEECLKRAKSEAGLGDYEVRSWPGWHHHQTLSLIAAWFLNTETRRGKKMDTRHYVSANPPRHRHDIPRRISMQRTRTNHTRAYETITAQ